MEGVTREGVRQIEKRAIRKIRLRLEKSEAAETPPPLFNHPRELGLSLER